MQRLLIVHSSQIYAQALSRKLGPSFDIRICCDGDLANQQIREFSPHILILHTALPRKDAVSILRQMTVCPEVILVLTNYLDTPLERSLAGLGVHRVLLMPNTATVAVCLSTVLASLDQRRQENNIFRLTAAHLHILNMPAHLDGFRGICVAVSLLYHDPQQTLTKQIYPAVAGSLSLGDARNAEHAIRSAISTAYQHCHREIWSKYFPPNICGKFTCPRNKEFLFRLMEFVQQEIDSHSATGTGCVRDMESSVT